MAKDYSELEAGYEFPPGKYRIDSSRVSIFLKAIGDTSPLYQETRFVPPMVVAALAMARLSDTISLPPGAIHVSQELSFLEAVTVDDNLTSYARLTRTQKRGKLHLLTVDLNVYDQSQRVVLTARTSFILPQPDDEQ